MPLANSISKWRVNRIIFIAWTSHPTSSSGCCWGCCFRPPMGNFNTLTPPPFYFGSASTAPARSALFQNKSMPNRVSVVRTFLVLVVAATVADQGAEAAKHVKVYSEPGRFGGWPANHGIWAWGNEILVGFSAGYYKDLGE